MYSMDTVPVKKTFTELLKNFVGGCYKKILKINKDVEMSEKDLANMLDVDTVDKMWKKRRMNAYSHIARLPYDNRARIVLFGKQIHKFRGTSRRFFNIKRTMMKDIGKIYDESTYCNLCNRRVRSTVYTSTE